MFCMRTDNFAYQHFQNTSLNFENDLFSSVQYFWSQNSFIGQNYWTNERIQ